jgi:purine-nucleoside/S-methyl-5'-thioadenosine phosphorylase / adenosine deaminase
VTFHHAGSIKYYQFDSLEGQGLYHAIFTRLGGLSTYPWESLNFGASVGDDIERVIHNREIALKSVDIDPDTVYDVYQIHSTNIVITNKPLNTNEPHVKADAILTNQPNVTLLMRFADCVPILLFDPRHQAIGIVHAGWIGTINRIAHKSIELMKEKFDSDPEHIICGIGPSIGPDHYSIGQDVIDKVKAGFLKEADGLLRYENGKTYFDLWKANRMIVEQAGVQKIEIAAICTQCNLSDWYSHRGEQGKTGRFGSIIGFKG